jgi:anti-anti-sigma factor
MPQTLNNLLTTDRRVTVDVIRFEASELLDPQEVELIEKQFKATIEASESPRLVLDMEQVEHVSSIMLSVLIEARSTTLDRKGRIALAAIQPRLRDLLEIVRIHDLFETYASTESAVTALLD